MTMKQAGMNAAALTAAAGAGNSGNANAWWRQPMVWLVLSGPFVVVVASFVTLGLAIHYGDPVLDTRTSASGADGAQSTALLPAVQGRNQAALQGSKAAAALAETKSGRTTENRQDPGTQASPRD